MHGDLRGAIEIYKALLESRPDDMRMQERFAALLRENGQLDAARILYRMIARHWEDTGFYLRAVTSYRTLVELDPSDLNAKRHLAELYAELHIVDRAVDIYRRLAETFAIQQNTRRRLAMLERIVDLVPEDVETQLVYASELDENGQSDEANKQLAQLLDLLHARKEWKRYAQIARRYLDRVPSDTARREVQEGVELRLKEAAGLTTASRLARGSSYDGASKATDRPLPPALPSEGEGSPFIRSVPASLFSSLEGADTSEDRSEASMLIELASIDAKSGVSRLPSPVPEPGELGPFASRPFGPTSEVILKEPGHVVAAALRARKRGDAVLALALLEDEGARQHPVAAAFERGVALAARQQWGAAMGVFGDIMDVELAPTDRALVAYHLGVVAEMTGDSMLAQVCFERVESLAPKEAQDVSGRLARL